ncbi:hypothetical protein PAAL109150_23325 [Paenibacillus alkaliterrae]
MDLPYGITGGYYDSLTEKKPPSIDKKKFYSKCGKAECKIKNIAGIKL